MINVKVKGKKNNRNAFFFVVAEDLKEAVDLAENAKVKGFTTNAGKKLDKITVLEVVDDDVIITDKVWNAKKSDIKTKEKLRKD